MKCYVLGIAPSRSFPFSTAVDAEGWEFGCIGGTRFGCINRHRPPDYNSDLLGRILLEGFLPVLLEEGNSLT